MAKAIDLERFARLTAEIEHGVPAPVLLSREGIAEGTWAEAQEEWLSTLAEETARDMDEAAGAVSDLAGQAGDLMRLIEEMRG